MTFPNYERQNKWIMDYIAPIVIELDFYVIFQNYKRNKKEAVRKERDEKVENKRTSLDTIIF